MRCYETYDEQNRLKSVEFTRELPTGKIEQSHGVSYLKAMRELHEHFSLSNPQNLFAYSKFTREARNSCMSYKEWVMKTCPMDPWAR